MCSPIIFFTSCSSGGGGESPSVNSIEGTWQYDSWVFNGDQLLNGESAYLFVCEEQEFWATEIYDVNGSITDYSSAGTYTLNNDQTEGTFTVSHVFDPVSWTWLALNLPQTISVTINKLDDDELDFSMEYGDNVEIIKSVKTPTEPPCEVGGLTTSLLE